MSREDYEPPVVAIEEIVTIIDLTTKEVEHPMIAGMWPNAKRIDADKISVAISNNLVVYGTTNACKEYFAAGMRVALEAEREMIAQRVQEGREAAGLPKHTQDAGRGAHDFSEGFRP